MIGDADIIQVWNCDGDEPVDRFETRQPRLWRFADGTAEYEWDKE